MAEEESPKDLESAEELRDLVRDALLRRRRAVVYSLARRLYSWRQSEVAAEQVSVGNDEWIPIESLSQLRQVVGGRFQNLKQKWMQAGFPLRRHRGDRAMTASVDKHAWMELSLWINRQGFDVRLGEGGSAVLFEVRKSN